MQKVNPFRSTRFSLLTSNFCLLTFPMPRKRSIKLRCPICKKPVKAADPEFPFCSDRCRTIDLGKWASGAYVIPVTETEAEDAIPDRDTDSEDES